MNSSNSVNLSVDMSHYQFLPKDTIPKNIKGFFTRNVCECVAGMISSDQGFGFFHYFRLDDPERLKSLISRDFGNATSVKITLFGGNPNFNCFPWKAENRELVLEKKDGTLLHNQEAASLLTLSNNVSFRHPNPKIAFSQTQPSYMEGIYMSNATIQENRTDSLICYNWTRIDESLKEKKFTNFGFVVSDAREIGFTIDFTITGIKDLSGYQNTRIIKDICSIFDANTTHFNCMTGADIFADFNGDIGAKEYSSFPCIHLKEFPGEEIGRFELFTFPQTRIKKTV